MMVGYDGEGTIPDSSLCGSFWQYVERVYGKRSLVGFFFQGGVQIFLSCFPTVLGSWFRGYAYKLLLGKMGSRCFLEKNICFYHPLRLFCGDRVFLGARAFFDVGDPEGAIIIGDDGHISRDVTVRTQLGKIKIGKKVNIGANSFLYGYGEIEIGDYCLIANQVEIITGAHKYDDLTRPMRFQGRSPSRIVIGEDVWIGTHAVIIGQVTIGKGAIIGAGAVVHNDVPEYAVAVGVPARVIRIRGDREKHGIAGRSREEEGEAGDSTE